MNIIRSQFGKIGSKKTNPTRTAAHPGSLPSSRGQSAASKGPTAPLTGLYAEYAARRRNEVGPASLPLPAVSWPSGLGSRRA